MALYLINKGESIYMDVNENYIKRKNKYTHLIKLLNKYSNYLAAFRLIFFLICLGFLINFYTKELYYMDISIALVFIIVYIILLNYHNKIKYNKKLCLKIIEINESSIESAKGEWMNFADTGKEFMNEKHPYINDLDIFGKGSLFQFINSTVTYMGRMEIKEALSKRRYSIDEIYERQNAIKELSNKIGWKQRFLAEGKINIEETVNPDELIIWGKEESYIGSKSKTIYLIKYIPIITFIIILIYFATHAIPAYFPIAALLIQVFLVYYKKEKRVNSLELVNLYKKHILIYKNMLKMIERYTFKSTYLEKLRGSLFDQNKESATKQIDHLANLVNLISDRKNFFYIVLNILTLWDYQCIFALDRWKIKSGIKMSTWLHIIGRFEELCSISNIKYDNTTWTMPKFTNDMEISAVKLGHPLITKNRVCNDLEIGKNEKIILVTGSNMSGKSTMLRTVGINLVLAYTGAPVCAESFYCPIMNIYTCMRTSDNIEENISSFYAELIKIKNIINAVKKHERVFFLLDEIFKGTNSFDRHTGAQILISKLSEKKIIGFISTHDLELGELEKQNSKIKNYYFEEYYKNNKIYFDYKFKKGVSTTRNALYLMKLAGIDTI